jgi:hypothetical protein
VNKQLIWEILQKVHVPPGQVNEKLCGAGAQTVVHFKIQ